MQPWFVIDPTTVPTCFLGNSPMGCDRAAFPALYPVGILQNYEAWPAPPGSALIWDSSAVPTNVKVKSGP